MPRSSRILLGVIVAAGAVCRFDRLGDLSYGFDEGFCWKLIGFGWGEIWGRCALDNFPPLYFYLLRLWSEVVGGSPEALRAMSALAGLAAVAGAYLLGRECVGQALQADEHQAGEPDRRETAGLLAAALVALSPMQVDWSQQVRMYSLGAALSLFSCWLLLRALRAGAARRPWARFTLSATLLAYTHYFGLFVVAAQFLCAAAWAVHAEAGRRRWGSRTVAPTLRGGEADNVRTGLPMHDAVFAALGGSVGAGSAAADGGTARSPFPAEAMGECHPATAHVERHGGRSLQTTERRGGRSLQNVGRHGAGSGQNPWAYPLVSAFVVQALWSPWLPEFLRHRRRVSAVFWTADFTWDEAANAVAPLASVGGWGASGDRFAALACLAFAGGILLFGGRGLRLIGLAALLTLGGAAAASLTGRNIFMSRYLVFAQALFLCGVAAVAAGIPWRAARWAVSAALLAAVAWPCWRHVERRDRLAERPGLAGAMAYLAAERLPGEPILAANPMVQIAAVAQSLGDGPVRVLARSAAFPFYQGTAVMRDDDYISAEQLSQSRASRVWVLDALAWTGGDWVVRLPDEWVDVAEETFPEQPWPATRFVVRRCVRRPSRARRINVKVEETER